MGQGLAGSCTDRRLRSRAGAGRGGGARQPGGGRLILAATRLDGGTRGSSDDENDNNENDNNNNENDYNNNENDYNDDNNQNDDAALGGRKSAQMQEQENRGRVEHGVDTARIAWGGTPLFSSRLSSCRSWLREVGRVRLVDGAGGLVWRLLVFGFWRSAPVRC